MKLGYNTNGLQNHRLDDALHLLADHGYQAVALTLDVVHLDPFEASVREIDRVAALLARLGLEVVIETGARFLLDPRRKHEPTLMTEDADGRRRRLAFLGRSAEVGAALGARVLSFWAGVDRAPRPDSWQRLVGGVQAANERIRAAGLTPAFEPEPGMAVGTMAEFARLREGCGADAPALALDVGHLYVTETDPIADCSRWAPHCRQVHLEDTRRGVHEHLPPGEGDVDFPRILAALRGAGYDGPICFELSRSSHRAPDLVRICQETFRAALDSARRAQRSPRLDGGAGC